MKYAPDTRNCWMLGSILLAACLLCLPFVEMGVNDDWSYIKTAQDLARTGHLVYNGWAAAMIGAQAYWGALFALLFGKESFAAVRLSMIPLAAGAVSLFYALCRRSGITAALAFFGALTLGLSPMFVPHAVTFMTDVPSLFLTLLCLYSGTRAYEEQDRILQKGATGNAFGGWLLAGTIAGMASGTVRQIGWVFPVLAAIVMVRAVLRSDGSAPGRGRLLLAHGAAVLISIAFALAINRWFSHQPYAIHEDTGKAIAEFLRTGAERFPLWKIVPFAVLYTMVLLAVPLLPLVRGAVFPGKESRVPVAVFLGVAVAFLILQILLEVTPPRRLFPWIQNTITDTEIWWDFIVGREGYYPVWITKPQRFVFSYVIVGLSTLLATGAVLGRLYGRHRESQTPSETAPFAVQLYGLFVWLYLALFLVKLFVPYSFGVLDRYLLPLLPGLILSLLWRRGQREPSRPARIASACLIFVYAYYGIARMHDCFAQRRAVMAISDRLTDMGIPRTAIKGGFEYNAWTQITTGGYYNDPRIVNPPGAFQPERSVARRAGRDHFQMYTPAVQGVLFIVANPQPDLFDTLTPPRPYVCWFPPFHRAVYLQTNDPRFRPLVLR